MDQSVSRRMFFKVSGISAAGATVAMPTVAEAALTDVGHSTLAYPRKLLGKIGTLKVNEPVAFMYPDAFSPCSLLKTGHRVPGGIGPDGDVVAYSTLCTHMGCPLDYDGQAKAFKCPCHFSQFDPEMAGQMICGQATENLPRVTLTVTPQGSISAIGMQGLIYGRQSNILSGGVA